MRKESEHGRARDYFRGSDKYSRDKHDNTGYRSKDKEKETSSLEHQKYKDKVLSSERAGSGRRHTNSNFEDGKAGDRDKHLRDGDGTDERKDYRRGDYKSDRSISHEESRGHRNDSTSGKDNGGYRSKEVRKNEPKDVDGPKQAKDENKKYDEWKTNKQKDRQNREPKEQLEDKAVISNENQESAAKKPKLVSMEKNTDYGKDGNCLIMPC